jgi:hypothetical protein
MALLTSPDMLPEAMRFLLRALLLFGRDGVERAELLDLVAPPGLMEAMKSLGGDAETTLAAGDPKSGGRLIATRSLEALSMLDVVIDANGGKVVAPADDVADLWKRPNDVTASAFCAFILDRLFDKAEPLAASGSANGVTDFIQALELLYTTTEPMRPFDRFEPDRMRRGHSFQDYQTEVVGSDAGLWPVFNLSRWPPFLRWASYLGLAQLVGSSGVVPDASAALAVRLADIPPGVYDIEEFVVICATAVPLFDGGELQTRHQPAREGDTAVLSSGLSLSLTQLEADCLVTLDKRSDTGVRIVRLGQNRTTDRAITTVEWKPGTRAKGGHR